MTKKPRITIPEEEDLIHHIMLTTELSWKYRITRANINEWLSNFKGEIFDLGYERRLALWLLTNFVYYNENEVRHLCKTLHNDFIHYQILKDYPDFKDVEAVLTDINKKTLYFALGRSGESGGFISYYFRKENKLSTKNFVLNPNDIDKDVKQIVFIDDVTLSSGKSQAIRYLKKDVEDFFPKKRILLLTLIASEKAIKNVKEKGYEIINCITLSERNQCFSDSSTVFDIHKTHLKDCENFSLHYGKKLNPSHPLGHKNAQLLFGFFYNTPNNSLPIFWADVNGWKPIIRRYHKNYKETNYDEIGRFI